MFLFYYYVHFGIKVLEMQEFRLISMLSIMRRSLLHSESSISQLLHIVIVRQRCLINIRLGILLTETICIILKLKMLLFMFEIGDAA